MPMRGLCEKETYYSKSIYFTDYIERALNIICYIHVYAQFVT